MVDWEALHSRSDGVYVTVVTMSACTIAMLAPEPLAGPLKNSAWRAHPATISEM